MPVMSMRSPASRRRLIFNPKLPPVPNRLPRVSVLWAPLNSVLNTALVPGLTLNDLTLELPVMTHWLLPSTVRSTPGLSSGFTLPVSTLLFVRCTVI